MIINTLMAWEKIQQITKQPDGQLFIWGAGMQGKRLKRELEHLGCTIAAFIESAPLPEKVKSLSIPQYRPDYLQTLKRGTFFVVSSVYSDEGYENIRREMMAIGLEELEDFGDFGLTHDLRTFNWLRSPFTEVLPRYPHKDKKADLEHLVEIEKARCGQKQLDIITDGLLVLPYVNVCLTTYCNLHCQDCAHTIPYCKSCHYDAQIILETLNKLLETIYTYQVILMGGEVFIYPQLEEFLAGLCTLSNKKHIGKLVIVTNGTIVPSDKSLVLLKSFGNSELQLSNYGVLSTANDILFEKTAELSLSYSAKPQIGKWSNEGDYWYSRNYSEKELEQLYHVCHVVPHCMILQNGRLYSCPRIAAQQESNLIPWDDNAFVDIRLTSSEQLSHALEKLLYKTRKLDGCQYCSGNYTNCEQVPMARQLPAGKNKTN